LFQNSLEANAFAGTTVNRLGNPNPVRIAWRLVITLIIDDGEPTGVTAMSLS
jgi:hypothetical protein